MHLVAATCLAGLIFALTSWRTGLPNKVLTECILPTYLHTFIHTVRKSGGTSVHFVDENCDENVVQQTFFHNKNEMITL